MKSTLQQAQQYPYCSFQYMDLDELTINLDEDIMIDEPGLFILCQFQESRQFIYWSTESKEKFLTGMSKVIDFIHNRLPIDKMNLYLEFIHPDFVKGMEEMGFKIVSEFVDYWNEDITQINNIRGHSCVIRTINSDEYREASSITKACRGLSRGFNGEELDSIREWNESDHSCILVAEMDNEIVGVCLINIYGFESEKGPVLWLRELAVEPKHQNKGIGSSLIVEGLSWGRSNGAKRSFLASDVENHNAIKIYESFGYRRKDKRGQINMGRSI
ncbi:GNAT family N-acetyltransferase [Paenibacillus segetis]|uniref:N-acetyltransferase domain-containing protein n=1 Tax=Paenibacillus segetis TaxID=1325360 RepID=A0ABQ1YI64_9BACL|nr:GNAT family N-acetyltransferase [Paenibacillus segetis]GGH26804.1 hypothetical protein GCM10008013_27840 [Paenibacillus segetis]